MATELITCLLPTGLLVTVRCPVTKTFFEVKDLIWREACRLPFYNELKDPNGYSLQSANPEGELFEVDDEQTLENDSIVAYVFKLVERKGSREEQLFNKRIGVVINKHLSFLDNIKNPEISAFRRNILSVCQEVASARDRAGDEGYAVHRFPPVVVSTSMPNHIKKCFSKKKHFHFRIVIGNSQESILRADINHKPQDVIKTIVKTQKIAHLLGSNNTSDFVLKVYGREEYFLGNFHMHEYKYVRGFLVNGPDETRTCPKFVLEKRAEFYQKVERPDQHQLELLLRRPPQTEENNGLADLMWYSTYSDDKFKLKIVDAQNLVTGNLFGVGVKASIYLGYQEVCQAEMTRYVPPTDNPVWGQWLEFGMAVKDIPRSARLCLSLHGVWQNPLRLKGKKRAEKNQYPLAWVNISVLDFRDSLRQGQLQLSTFKYYDEEEDEGELKKLGGADLFNPLGTTLPNISKSTTPTLTIEFKKYPHEMKYPGQEMIGRNTTRKVPERAGRVALELTQMERLIRVDPLHVYKDEELKMIRQYKYHVKDQPEALSKCLRAVDWSTNESAHEVVDMLRSWAALQPEHALELLDADFADQTIRSHAVQYLDSMSDDELVSYLLQLVQVLKYELFLDCELARFLLRRALKSQRIGHFFFWHLKSEMHLPDASLRFGLLLEAYLRGCGAHINDLEKQVFALNGIQQITEGLKDKQVKGKKEYAQERIQALPNTTFQLPLDPSITISNPVVRKVFNSAQKPLWLQFDVQGARAENFHVMFKDGDDLRQDMLTLQLISIMDRLWQANGLDFKLNCYSCLSTGDMVGLLQMVQGADTIWSIQDTASNIWRPDSIYKWLQTKNQSEDELEAAVRNFMLSCVGYSVATYVLGIADRHNDNIMIKTNGEYFHIDFGHFLGKWKYKFGIKRERVKFVLTDDFQHIITSGQGSKSPKWAEFKDLCIRAFKIVRENSALFINLLKMLLCTGMPELTLKNIGYLRKSLFLEDSAEVAVDNFDKEIDTALKDCRSVKVNWAFHAVKHPN